MKLLVCKNPRKFLKCGELYVGSGVFTTGGVKYRLVNNRTFYASRFIEVIFEKGKI